MIDLVRSEDADVFSLYRLIATVFTGGVYQANFTIHQPRFNHSMKFKANYLAIDDSKNKFRTVLSGFIGIEPYTALPIEKKEMNFMYMLKRNGYIDHLTVSFYIAGANGESFMKFGSYDPVGIADGE